MFLLILYYSIQFTYSLIPNNVTCSPSLDDCKSLLTYFQFQNAVHSYIHLILPFTITQETFTISSADSGAAFPEIVLSGGPYFKVTTAIPNSILMKGYLSLNTVRLIDPSTSNLNTTGPFQMRVVAYPIDTTLVLQESIKLAFFYKLKNKLFSITTVAEQSIVIPTSAGICSITDWKNVIKKNKIRQLNYFIIQLSQDMTNDRLDISLTLSAVPAGFTFHRECYLSGSDLSRVVQTCIISQNANVLQFLIRVMINNSQNVITLLKAKTSYTIEFFITHSGTVMETQTFTTQILRDNIPLDIASGTNSYLIDTTTEAESITEVSLYLNTPNIKVPTLFGLMFRPRQLEYDTLIKVQLGFIQALDTFNCIVYQIQSDGILEPTMNFKSYYLNTDLYFITNNESPYLMNVKYSINCTGMIINPNDGVIRIIYQDLYNTIISIAEIAQPLVIPSLDSTNNNLVIVKSINIIKKEFNYPLTSTVISFSIKPTSYVRRVIVEFPYYYSYVSLSCLFNNTIIDCIPSSEIKNRIIIYIQTKLYIKIKDAFNITISGMINPSQIPYNGQIYILVDDDNYMDALIQDNLNQLNGIIQSERIDDFIETDNYKNTPQTIGIPLQLITSTTSNKISLYWYKVNSNNEYTRLVGTLPHFEINTNYFNEYRLFLGHYDYQSRFNITMNLQFPQIDDIILYGSSSYLSKQSYTNEQLILSQFLLTSLTDTNIYTSHQDKNMTINPGDSGYWFNICAKDVISGEYNITLNFSLIYPLKNSWNLQKYNNYYIDIPTISLRVVQQDCQYSIDNTEYILPYNGTTLPIIIDASKCIPLYDQKLNLEYDNNNKLELIPIQMSLSRKRMEQLKRQSSKQILSKYIFKFATTQESTPGIITQIRISNLLLNIKCILHVDSPLIATPLIGTYSDVVNRLTLSLGCSEVSEINLLIGIDEVSDSEYSKIPNQIGITLSDEFNIFSILPQNLSIQNYGQFTNSLTLDESHLISEMYLNDIANNIMYDESNLIKQINQTSLKDSQSSPILSLINNIKLSRRNLLERGNQLQLQRYYVRVNQLSQFSFPINNLQYNTKYSIGYYCRNLLNNVSTLTQNFMYINNETTKNNQIKGYMLNMIFRTEITEEQKNNILCSISQYYAFNYYQVLGNDCNQCRILNTTYNKMNYSTYLQLNESFIPYENRTPSEQQRYTDELYTMHIYLNNYMSSAGYSIDANKAIQQKSSNITLDLIRDILNITDDLELQYLLDNYGYVNLTQIKRGEVELAKQIVINKWYVKNDKLYIEIKANSNIYSIVGLHKLEPLFENDIKHPSGLQLRRGVLGTMDKISEGVQLNQIDSGNNKTIAFSNLIDNQKYILYWSSSDLYNDCLSRQYSNTGYKIITYQKSNQNFEFILGVIMLLFIMNS